MKIHLVYEEEYIQPLKDMLESAGHEIDEWDYSVGQFADFSEKKQTTSDLAIIDIQAGVIDRKEIIDLLSRARNNLPTLRLILAIPEALERDAIFISKLLTLSIYDMHFKDEYDVDDIEHWISNPKNYSDYNIETKDVKGDLGEKKPKLNSLNQDRRQVIQREYRAFAAKIIVITGVKGGVGKTDVSINLAAAFKKNIKNARVCLLDFDFPYGGISRALGICPDNHLGDWLTESKILTEEGVKSRVSRYEGIDIIPMAIKIKDGLDFQKRQAESMLDALRKYYDVIIVDTSSFSESALAAITISSEVIFICSHDVVSISATHAYKEDLINIYGVDPYKMSIYLNLVPAHEDISKEKIAEVFEDSDVGIPVIGYSPHDDLVRQHRNKRAFIYNEMPTHSFSQGINMIMQSLGLNHQTFANPVDTFKEKMGGVINIFQKLKKKKDG